MDALILWVHRRLQFLAVSLLNAVRLPISDSWPDSIEIMECLLVFLGLIALLILLMLICCAACTPRRLSYWRYDRTALRAMGRAPEPVPKSEAQGERLLRRIRVLWFSLAGMLAVAHALIRANTSLYILPVEEARHRVLILALWLFAFLVSYAAAMFLLFAVESLFPAWGDLLPDRVWLRFFSNLRSALAGMGVCALIGQIGPRLAELVSYKTMGYIFLLMETCYIFMLLSLLWLNVQFWLPFLLRLLRRLCFKSNIHREGRFL